MAIKPKSVEATPVESAQPTRLSELPAKNKVVRLRNKITGMKVSLNAKRAANLLKTKPDEYEPA